MEQGFDLGRIGDRSEMIRFFGGWSSAALPQGGDARLRHPLLKSHLLDLSRDAAEERGLQPMLQRCGLEYRELDDTLGVVSDATTQERLLDACEKFEREKIAKEAPQLGLFDGSR